jgi:hypothetical protein
MVEDLEGEIQEGVNIVDVLNVLNLLNVLKDVEDLESNTVEVLDAEVNCVGRDFRVHEHKKVMN